jgi:hypothetical protein
MITTALQNFSTKIIAKGRIMFADVRWLRRAVLPDGIADRGQAALLIALDRRIGAADPAWDEAFVELVAGFAIWGERPTGVISPDLARWLAGELAGGGGEPPARNARAVLAEIADAAHAFADDALSTLAAIPAARSPAAALAQAA